MNFNAERQAQLRDLFAAIDAKNTERFLGHISSTASFRFGSAAPVTGHEAIREAVDGFFATIGGLKHEVRNAIFDGTILACEGEVTYTRLDKSTITLPFANVFDFDGDLITGYRIYVDVAPLYGGTP